MKELVLIFSLSVNAFLIWRLDKAAQEIDFWFHEYNAAQNALNSGVKDYMKETGIVALCDGKN